MKPITTCQNYRHVLLLLGVGLALLPARSLGALKCAVLFDSTSNIEASVSYIPKTWIPPQVHIDNLQQHRLPLGTRFYRVGISEQSVGDGNIFYFPESNRSSFIEGIAPDRSHFSVTSLLGRRFFRFGKTPEGLWYEEVPIQSTVFFKQSSIYPEPLRMFLNFEQVPQNFLESQISFQKRASDTLTKDQRGDEHGLREANRYVLNLLLTSQRFDADFVEKINGLIIKNELVGQNALAAGIIRGSAPRTIQFEGKMFLVDLSQTQIKNTVPSFFYIPALNVPARIADWLTKANRIDQKSNLKEIIQLYRDFIIIHPFVNGNGRTGRVLLDGLLLKAGFPPVPHSKSLTAEVLFKTLDESFEDFKRAYAEHK